MKHTRWIKSPVKTGSSAVSFVKKFTVEKGLVSAIFKVSSIGIYTSLINGKAIGHQVLTPGWTSYHHRVQYMTEDITSQIEQNNDPIRTILSPSIFIALSW